MTEARLSVTLPEYETELAANQRTALRTAALLAAPILVAFTLLDRASAPAWWLPLLGIRLVAAAALAAMARLAPRFAGSPVALAGCAVAVICGPSRPGHSPPVGPAALTSPPTSRCWPGSASSFRSPPASR